MINRAMGARASLLALALGLGALTAAPSVAAPQSRNGWGVALTDVTPDPAIRYGTLPNGMKYAVMRNATPKGTASVRLQFAFGSIAESENERGLAHFIEHMAFNGTTHVPEGDMVKILQRQGLAFGPDTNAVTGFDTTTYMLDLPRTDSERLDTALFLLREVASEVKFDSDAVNRERGVILGEKRARENFQLRQVVDLLNFQLPQTPYSDRIPIGTEAVLKTATPNTIRNLYERYYRPENATLVFVGDADPAAIEALIKAKFGEWKGKGAVGSPLPRGKVDLTRPAAFDTFVDPAVAVTADLTVERKWTDEPDTIAERQRKRLEEMATGMFNRRIERLTNVPDSPLLGGAMLTQEQKDAARLTSVKVAAKDGAWKEAVDTAQQEVRRVLEHGFTESELKTQIANTRGALQAASDQADTRTNQSLANAILSTVGDDEFVTTPAYRLAQFAAVAPKITLADVNAAFRRLWTGSAPLVHLSTKQDIAAQQVATAFAASRATPVPAGKDFTAQAFAYDSFGAPGTVAEDKRIADLDVRTIRFSNNVRLNIKKTDFEAGKVRFLVRMGDGVLDLPENEPGLGFMMTVTSSIGGLKKHSLDELKELMAGRIITLGTAVTDDAFVSTGTTTAKDLPLQMKVSAAYLTDPGFRPEAASQWANAVPVVEKQFDSQPQTVALVRLPIILAAGDARFGIPSADVLQQRKLDEARAALAPVIASDPIEITIIGDVDENAAIKAVANSFGALPTRKLAPTVDPSAREAKFRTAHTPIVLDHDGNADQALVEAAWPTDDDSDYRQMVGLDTLARVLDVMLTDTVREKLGDTYGVSLRNVMSDTFGDFGFLSASAVVAPDKTDEVEKAIADAAAELRAKPVDADLLARARKPALEAIDRSRRENAYWLAALSKAQSDPARLERIRKQRSLVEAVTPADLQDLAGRYLRSDKVQHATIVSSKVGAKTAR